MVAADKGTATSDIANAISIEHDYWLGDAASGGSAGYDHKAMGTRGAREAVKRHFREMDVDIGRTPFNVVGVGDMSRRIRHGMWKTRSGCWRLTIAIFSSIPTRSESEFCRAQAIVRVAAIELAGL